MTLLWLHADPRAALQEAVTGGVSNAMVAAKLTLDVSLPHITVYGIHIGHAALSRRPMTTTLQD